MGFINILTTLVPIGIDAGGKIAETIARIKAQATADGYYADTVILSARSAEDARRQAISEAEMAASLAKEAAPKAGPIK
jgi:putative heme iron utilization protein